MLNEATFGCDIHIPRGGTYDEHSDETYGTAPIKTVLVDTCLTYVLVSDCERIVLHYI